MTAPIDLAAVKARAAAATEGPWRQEPNTAAGRVWVQMSRHYGHADLEPLFSVRSRQSGKRAEFEQREADAEFIAHARTDVPALVEVAEHLDDVLAFVVKTLDNVNGGTFVWQNDEVVSMLLDIVSLAEGRSIDGVSS